MPRLLRRPPSASWPPRFAAPRLESTPAKTPPPNPPASSCRVLSRHPAGVCPTTPPERQIPPAPTLCQHRTANTKHLCTTSATHLPALWCFTPLPIPGSGNRLVLGTLPSTY